jgi:hypothetical protein
VQQQKAIQGPVCTASAVPAVPLLLLLAPGCCLLGATAGKVQALSAVRCLLLLCLLGDLLLGCCLHKQLHMSRQHGGVSRVSYMPNTCRQCNYVHHRLLHCF